MANNIPFWTTSISDYDTKQDNSIKIINYETWNFIHWKYFGSSLSTC